MLAAKDPVGPRNDHYIEHFCHTNPRPHVVCAWGADGNHLKRDEEVLELLAFFRIVPKSLGETKDGHPKHPLYVSYKTPLTAFANAFEVIS